MACTKKGEREMTGFKQRLATLVVGVLVMSSVAVIATAESASAAVTPKTGAAGALDIAQAIASSSANVTGASFVSTTGGTPNGTADSGLGEFPTDSSTFGILTTGNVSSVPNAATFASTDNAGANVRGNTDFDVTVLKADVTVPPAANCLAFDFKFLSEEYPQYIESQYNDAFIAEIDNSTWTTTDSAITAPDNFAFDSSGNVVSINSTGIGGLTPADGAGTAFDSSGGDPNGAATGLLHAARQVAPGAHSVYFSIFDQGDHNYDSAVFLDNLVVGFVANPSVNCAPGATPVTFNLGLTPQSATNPTGTQHTVTATLTDASDNPVGGAPISFAVAGANPGSGSDTTDEGGQATFTYTGNNAGTDQIGACYDADNEAPCEAVASAEKVWTPVVGLSVSSALDPTTVSAGDDVLDTATITATGTGIAHAVTAVVSAAGSGGTAAGATVSQGSCGAPSSGQVTCTIGDLAAGSSATIDAVFTTPTTVPAGGTFSVTTTAHSSDIPPAGVSSTATATETPKTPNHSEGFVQPGDSISQGPAAASPATNTVSKFTLPNTGDGASISLSALVSPAGFCGGTVCKGKVIELSPFEGYHDPLNPTRLGIRFDKSVVTHGTRGTFYEQTSPGGPIKVIPECAPRPGWTKLQKLLSAILKILGFGPNSGYASPSPCINSKLIASDGDLIVEVLLLSGDPKVGYK